MFELTGVTAMGDEARSHEDDRARTIYVAVEMSRKSWVVGIRAPDADRIGVHGLPAADVDRLTALIDRSREALERDHGTRGRVLCCYEAGYEGFWLARRLAQAGVETLVLDAASFPAERKARRVKTDRTDAVRMVRALMARDLGEPAAVSTVRVPSVEEEDRKRLLRERRRLIKKRTMTTNTIRGLLMLHGVYDLNPHSKRFTEALDAVRTGYGTPLPPGVHAEIRRAARLLRLVEEQIAEVEAERDRIVERAGDQARQDAGGPSGAMLARLAGLRGVGANDAAVLVHEVFCREFRNRRELASWTGLTPAPRASGGSVRSQGIDKAGPAWVRAQLVQLAWRWLRYQPESALSRWFRSRAGTAQGRMRQVFLVALARKLLVALWRYATSGVVPEGAKLA